MAKKSVSPIAHMIRRLAEDHCIKHLSDQELARRFASGQDEAAFCGVLRRHGSMVMNVCRNVAGNEADAEDAFQATFLVLAQKAKSIRNLASLGSWLHGVAYRTALKGRKDFARRRKYESRAPHSTGQESADDLPWREVQHLIHAELTMLSEHYRAPLVLCFLEGRTQDVAAKLLGVSLATLKKRLDRGRSLLRLRLVRRGLGPAALVAASAWPAAKASACVPPTLVAATVKAALALAGGQTTAGLVSAKVGYLVANALKVTLATKLKIGVAVVLALALVPTFGERAFQTRSTGSATSTRASGQAPLQASTPKGAPSTPKSSVPQRKQTLIGRMLDPMGKPAAGAKLFLVGAKEQPTDLGVSAADGGFEVVITAPKERKLYYLVAKLPGTGLDFISVSETLPSEPIEFRAVKDNPIRGRIINTEGKPVARAKVAVIKVGVYGHNSLDPFLVAWRKRSDFSDIRYPVRHIEPGVGEVLSTTTDSDGRFTIQGAGAERVITLAITGEGIAESRLWVVNRPGFDPDPLNQESRERASKGSESGIQLLHGPETAIVAEAERRIRGVMKDIDTGKPRAGVRVYLTRNGDDLPAFLLNATTDSEGRYALRGARKATSYTVEVFSDASSGHLGCQLNLDDTPGYGPITADIFVKQGVILKGKVFDAVTKKPLPGWGRVDPLSDNSFAEKYPQFASSATFGVEQTGADNEFRMVTVPGPVLLFAGVDSRRLKDGEVGGCIYKPAVSDSKYPQYFKRVEGGIMCLTAGGRSYGLFGNYCTVLQIKPEDRIVTHDVFLQRAAALPISMRDVDGGPLAGIWVSGMILHGPGPAQVKADSCSVYNLETGKPRLMVFYEPTKKLIGTLGFKGDEKGPVVATLGRPGLIKGRLIAEDGKPKAGVVVSLHLSERFAGDFAGEMHGHIHRAKLIETDSDGKFQMDEIIPGQDFSVRFTKGAQSFVPLAAMANRSVQAGATLDLGDVKVKRQTEQEK